MPKELSMFDPKDFEDLSKKLYDSLPSTLKNLESDIQNRFQEILRATFQKMDLVTREEFDVQVKVLLRTREKLEALEKEIESISKKKATKKNK